MKYYHKYQTSLEAAGYTVDEYGYVWDAMGNQSAGEDNYGNVQSKDPNVTDICIAQDASPILVKVAKKIKAVVAPMGKKRARTDKGHYIADDPTTPENEAWVDK
jgi:hypothetical protein|tara:strand:- start:626 stop:937 length:312 start_codon:yes stop_codon:yes gene_type:complete